METLKVGITILGMLVAACFLVLLGGVLERRSKLSTLATGVGIVILGAIVAFVIYAALVLFA